MNLFVNYSKEEVEYILSLTDKNHNLKIPLFKGLLKNEIDNLCKYISIEHLNAKKVVDDYDYIWIIDGCLVEIENKKIIKKFYKNTLIGIKHKLFKEKIKPLVTLKESKLILFDIKDVHNEFSSIFYKNLSIYLGSKFSDID